MRRLRRVGSERSGREGRRILQVRQTLVARRSVVRELAAATVVLLLLVLLVVMLWLCLCLLLCLVEVLMLTVERVGMAEHRGRGDARRRRLY